MKSLKNAKEIPTKLWQRVKKKCVHSILRKQKTIVEMGWEDKTKKDNGVRGTEDEGG